MGKTEEEKRKEEELPAGIYSNEEWGNPSAGGQSGSGAGGNNTGNAFPSSTGTFMGLKP